MARKDYELNVLYRSVRSKGMVHAALFHRSWTLESANAGFAADDPSVTMRCGEMCHGCRVVAEPVNCLGCLAREEPR